MKTNRLFLAALITYTTLAAVASAQTDDALAWPEVEMEHRPATYWWWPASAVDAENITWNLELFRDAGMGGAHVIPIYGVRGEEDRFIDYLSPEWMSMLNHATSEAKRLGMWIDMSTGTGWPFGGPWVPESDADIKATYENGTLSFRPARRVKRAAPGGAGFSVNPFSPDAVRRYLIHFDEAFKAIEAPLPRAQYHDSFEYAGNWTRELLEEFEKRRGYDLEPHLADIFGDDVSDKTKRIKSDYRETLADLHLEFIQIWTDWARNRGHITRNQAHGAPGNLLDLYAATDIPETEIFGARKFDIPGLRHEADNVASGNYSLPIVNRFASSAAHVAGRRRASSETCTWLRNHFRCALSQVKPEIDLLFLSGINHVFYHGSCYSPKDAEWPGWLFYASTEFNPRNAFWRDISALNGYIARCQSILQSGDPDNDILLYWPVYDEWHRPDGLTHGFTVHHIEWFTEAPVGKLAQELLDKGYTFDLVSDAQIRGLSVEEGRIVTEAGVPYRTVLVPRTTYMPVDTLESLAAVANEGGSVLFHEALPADVPGYLEVEVRRAALEAVRDAFGLGADNGSGLQRSQVGKGMAALSGDTGLLLAEPEVAAEPLTQHGIGFIRRVHPQGRHYFLANQGTSALDGWVALATRADSAVLLCPTTERTGLGEVRQQDGRTEVYLQLQPGETLFLRTFEERIVDGEAWEYRVPRGLGVALENPWRVEFIDGGPALPKAYTAKTLVSWADRDNPRAKRFAGTALYSTEFDLPGNVECDDWMVDLGNVRESARVRVNGVDAGVLWSIPYTARVGHLLRPGKNRLEVEVTNLSANRIRDLDVRGVEWRIFHDINFVDQNYNKFDASKWPLQDSGLLGPVTLVPLAAVQPTG